MTAKGYQKRFPLTRLSAGCGFRKETIAGMRRNGRDAPKGDICIRGIKLAGSTDSGPSRPRPGTGRFDPTRSSAIPIGSLTRTLSEGEIGCLKSGYGVFPKSS